MSTNPTPKQHKLAVPNPANQPKQWLLVTATLHAAHAYTIDTYDTHCRGSHDLSFDDIVAVWKARQESIRSFDVELEGEVTHTKGTMFWSPTMIKLKGIENLSPVPAETVTFEFVRSFAADLQNSATHYEEDAPLFHAEKGQFYRRHFIRAIRSGLVTEFKESESLPDQDPSAIIYDRELANGNLISTHLWPLICSLCPLNSLLSRFDATASWRVADHEVVVDGRPCLLLERIHTDFWKTSQGDAR